jgi:hypothetical protein
MKTELDTPWDITEEELHGRYNTLRTDINQIITEFTTEIRSGRRTWNGINELVESINHKRDCLLFSFSTKKTIMMDSIRFVISSLFVILHAD